MFKEPLGICADNRDDLPALILCVAPEPPEAAHAFHYCRTGLHEGLMPVVALDREAGINPVLLTFGIVTHIGVSQRRQFTGGVL